MPLRALARRARSTFYAETWRETGAVGRRFLIGAGFYATRLGAVLLLLPLLASARGYDESAIGVLISASSLPLLLLSLPVTWLARRGWNRHLLALAPLLAGLGLALVAILPAGTLAATAAAAFLSGIGGAAFWPLGDPILAGTTPPRRRTHIFALKFFFWIVGMAAGGALGGVLPSLFAALGLSREHALAGVLLLLVPLDLAQTATFWSLPLPRSAPPTVASTRAGQGPVPWPLLLALVVPEICVAVGYGSIKPFLSLFLVEGRGFTTAATGSVLALAAAAGGAGVLALPAIIGRFGSLSTIIACRLIGAASIALWFASLGAPPLVALICLYWATIDGTEGPYVAAALERVPISHRGLFSGLYALFWSAGSASASFLGGRVQQATDGFAIAFAIGIAGYLIFAAWVALVFPRLPRLDPEPDAPATPEPDRPEVAAIRPSG